MDAINDFPLWFTACSSTGEIVALLLFSLLLVAITWFYLHKLHKQKKITMGWMVVLGIVALLVMGAGFLFVGDGIYKRNCKNQNDVNT